MRRKGAVRVQVLVWRVACLSALTALVASCGSTGSRTDMSISLESAKSRVISMEQEIASRVPEEYVVSRSAQDTSSLMSCGGDRKQWTGATEVQLNPGLDRDLFLDDLARSLSGRDGWDVNEDRDTNGERRLDVVNQDGTELLISFYSAPETLRVAGFSACFDFPEYQYGEKY